MWDFKVVKTDPSVVKDSYFCIIPNIYGKKNTISLYAPWL